MKINKDYEDMSWQEIIKFGMEVIADGCDRNNTLQSCHSCPFDMYCDVIKLGEEAGYKVEIPECWKH